MSEQRWWGPDGREVDQERWKVLLRIENARLRAAMSEHFEGGRISVVTRYVGESERPYRTMLVNTPRTSTQVRNAEVLGSWDWTRNAHRKGHRLVSAEVTALNWDRTTDPRRWGTLVTEVVERLDRVEKDLGRMR